MKMVIFPLIFFAKFIISVLLNQKKEDINSYSYMSDLYNPFSWLSYYKNQLRNSIDNFSKYYEGYKFLMANLYKIAFDTEDDLSLNKKNTKSSKYKEKIIYSSEEKYNAARNQKRNLQKNSTNITKPKLYIYFNEIDHVMELEKEYQLLKLATIVSEIRFQKISINTISTRV